MSRQIIEVDAQALDEGLDELRIVKPVRLVFHSPRRGGPPLASIRAALAPKGKLRFSAVGPRVFVDVDPGDPEPLAVALDTIVRSDAAGLERMLLSVLPHVDEIVLGVDGRSDTETLKVAEAYADCVYVFEGAQIGLSAEAWAAGKIDFSAARNLGRARVRSPFTLVLDSDEYLKTPADFRKLAREATPTIGGYGISVQLGIGFHITDDNQRFARTEYRWAQATHNQLFYSGEAVHADGALIMSDLSLRSAPELARRLDQRDQAVNDMVEAAGEGELVALFHVIKHKAGRGDLEMAAKLAEDYRLRIEPHSTLADERAWAAMCVAFGYYNAGKHSEAEIWALRALFDGPRIVVFCLLGDMAEIDGDLPRALGWYEAACAISTPDNIDWPSETGLRFGRLAGIKKALENPDTAPIIELIERDENVPVDAPPPATGEAPNTDLSE